MLFRSTALTARRSQVWDKWGGLYLGVRHEKSDNQQLVEDTVTVAKQLGIIPGKVEQDSEHEVRPRRLSRTRADAGEGTAEGEGEGESILVWQGADAALCVRPGDSGGERQAHSRVAHGHRPQ